MIGIVNWIKEKFKKFKKWFIVSVLGIGTVATITLYNPDQPPVGAPPLPSFLPLPEIAYKNFDYAKIIDADITYDAQGQIINIYLTIEVYDNVINTTKIFDWNVDGDILNGVRGNLRNNLPPLLREQIVQKYDEWLKELEVSTQRFKYELTPAVIIQELGFDEVR